MARRIFTPAEARLITESFWHNRSHGACRYLIPKAMFPQQSIQVDDLYNFVPVRGIDDTSTYLRGWYARACGHMVRSYPFLREKVFATIMQPNQIVTWSKKDPMSDDEMDWYSTVQNLQGNPRLYLQNPHYTDFPW